MKLKLGLFEEEIDPPGGKWRAFDDPAKILGISEERLARYEILPLKAGWSDGVPLGCFRSGAGPLEALHEARKRILAGELDAALIHGAEPLKTGYTREERHRLMSIYPALSIPETYDRLAGHFCAQRNISETEFREIADALYANYVETFLASEGGTAKLPGLAWHQPVTPLFKGVDCANPLIDYKGQLLLYSSERVSDCPALARNSVALEGLGFRKLPFDGPEHTGEIAEFAHLGEAVEEAEAGSGKTITSLVQKENALLETYTCYPVIPLAFLYAAKLTASPGEALAFLTARPVTISGGMNLARAPWNLPVLRALIRMAALLTQKGGWGVVHGNGGAGYSQGVAILKKI